MGCRSFSRRGAGRTDRLELLVTGGLKPEGRSRERLRASLRVLDVVTGRLVRSAWLDDVEAEPLGSHRETTVACLGTDGRLLVPSRAAVYEVDPARLTGTRVFYHPRAADIHSICPRTAGGFWITATAADAVLGVDERWAVQDTWELATREELPDDLRGRPYASLKPHRVHPNFAWDDGQHAWATCFEGSHARSRHGRCVQFAEGQPHDGVLRDGLRWFTLVTGYVLGVQPETLEVVERYDLGALSGTKRLLGWCRGIEVVGDRIYVGMTQLRSTTHREVLRWMALGEAGRKAPTRVLEIQRGRRPKILREFPVGNRAGGTIHGLLALTPGG